MKTYEPKKQKENNTKEIEEWNFFLEENVEW